MPLVTLLLLISAATLTDNSGARPDSLDIPVPGIVRDEAGRPVPGAFVTAHSRSGTLHTTVRARPDGTFDVPEPLFAVNGYTISAPGFNPVKLDPPASGNPGIEIELVPAEDFLGQIPSSRFLSLLPDGEEKRKFILDCSGCHQFDWGTISLDGRLKSRSVWEQRTQQMLSFSGSRSGFPVMSPGRYTADTAGWLTRHLGDETAPLPEPGTPEPPTAAETEFVITEYDLPVAGDLPHDLIVDDDGRVVITGMMTHQMYVLDPETGAFEHVPIPVGGANPRANLIAPNGDWWVLLGMPHRIARRSAATGEWSFWPIGMYGHSLALGDDGRVWFNGHFTKDPEQIGVLDPSTGDVRTIDVPVAPRSDGGTNIPYGLRLGRDGILWGTQLEGNRLVRYDTASGAFALFEMPETVSGPRRPDIAPDGSVWIPEYSGNRIARFDPETESFEEWDLPIPDALPYIVRVHPASGDIWIATSAADAVLRFIPGEERFLTYRVPTQGALMRHMDIDERTGDVWVAYGESPTSRARVAQIRLTGAAR